ncbi:WAT1-related protein At3g02690, chloroplastic isoform X2 [Arachis stenosperma]|uniref:WAT1-related protein At3g02690, chloroplastic isoform X2 n=1 Tax=Arachis stenosperma TaxID=217475 RepID=UPI0025AB8947|nr:WAT1-related protein At3g02690, chloroplastic isoform X2 [Arachis stenosperma]
MACCCTSPSATATAGRYFSIHNSRSSQFRINTFPFLPSPSSTAACSIRFRVPRTTSLRHKPFTVSCTPTGTEQQQLDFQDPPPSSALDCVGTGQDVECIAPFANEEQGQNGTVSLSSENNKEQGESLKCLAEGLWELTVLISPFFFWGTAMVAMKEVIPKTGPFFVSAFRLIPAGFLLVGFAASRGRPFPSGLNAWLSISLFALVDAACFQGFLAEGLQRTSAGLGSVIIDSQPLTVAVLAALLFGESIGIVGAAGLVLGVVGLVLLELPVLSFDESNFSLWGSGEWWMLLAAQSMAVGTVMVRWVSKYSDPVMATGWHMVIGGLPLVAFSILNNDPALSQSLQEYSSTDILALLYTSIFGSAVSYGVFFYSATKGSLTKLSSLTFLTPMFASIFGFLYLGETFTPVQLVGAIVTIAAIYMVNFRNTSE